MPPPFRSRTVEDFADELDAFDFGDMRLTGVHVHHTYRPDHETFRQLGGRRCVAGMHRYHTGALGWSDIAQHESVGPDGSIWSGRDWQRPPASSRGYNGTPRRHPFMFEMIGDFETVEDMAHDSLTGPQRDAATSICALVCQRFGLRPGDAVKFHRELGERWKSCPGNLIGKDAWIADVEAWDPDRDANRDVDRDVDRDADRAPADATGADLPAATARLYEIRAGDTLWSIAGRHGLSLSQLCEWNDLDPARPIHPGAVLTLPAGAREIAQDGETA